MINVAKIEFRLPSMCTTTNCNYEDQLTASKLKVCPGTWHHWGSSRSLQLLASPLWASWPPPRGGRLHPLLLYSSFCLDLPLNAPRVLVQSNIRRSTASLYLSVWTQHNNLTYIAMYHYYCKSGIQALILLSSSCFPFIFVFSFTTS